MSDLYPTKTRLALLAAVDGGDVLDGLTESTEGHTWLTFDDGGEPVKVDARIEEAFKAGWVWMNEPPVWRLTDLGREVLKRGAVMTIPTMLEVQDGFYDDEAVVEDWERWTVEAEDASWLADDKAQERRADR